MAIIKSKQELEFYILADRIMNGYPSRPSVKERLLLLLGISFLKDRLKIIEYLRLMRTFSYLKHKPNNSILDKFRRFCVSYKFYKYGEQLGFTIGPDVLGYGVVIPHYGTIIINNNNKIGNFCVIHTSVCIGGSGKIIGDALYLSAGSMISGNLSLGNGVTVGMGSVVKKSFHDHLLIGGVTANIIKSNYPSWYDRDGDTHKNNVAIVESLKKSMHISL